MKHGWSSKTIKSNLAYLGFLACKSLQGNMFWDTLVRAKYLAMSSMWLEQTYNSGTKSIWKGWKLTRSPIEQKVEEGDKTK